MTQGSGLTDKLYWRPYVAGWHCYKRADGRRRGRYVSLCRHQHEIPKLGGQSIDRPIPMLRCAGCDSAEIKRRGWTESGPETIDIDQIYDLYG